MKTKRIFIIRHAKSDWTHADVLKDIDRPLNTRGVRDSYTMSARLKAKNIIPDIILSSNGIRALHTAIIFSKELGFEAKGIKVIESLFHCSAKEILNQVNLYIDKVDVLFLYAHNPGIADFGHAVNVVFDKIPTCSILEFSVKKFAYKKITFKDLILMDFDYPKK